MDQPPSATRPRTTPAGCHLRQVSPDEQTIVWKHWDTPISQSSRPHSSILEPHHSAPSRNRFHPDGEKNPNKQWLLLEPFRMLKRIGFLFGGGLAGNQNHEKRFGCSRLRVWRPIGGIAERKEGGCCWRKRGRSSRWADSWQHVVSEIWWTVMVTKFGGGVSILDLESYSILKTRFLLIVFVFLDRCGDFFLFIQHGVDDFLWSNSPNPTRSKAIDCKVLHWFFDKPRKITAKMKIKFCDPNKKKIYKMKGS